MTSALNLKIKFKLKKESKHLRVLNFIHFYPNTSNSVITTVTTSNPVKENPFWHTGIYPKGQEIIEIFACSLTLTRIWQLNRQPIDHVPLKFNAPGKFIAKAEAERAAAQIRQLEREIAEATEDLGSEMDVALIGDILRAESENNLEFEWWDVPFCEQVKVKVIMLNLHLLMIYLEI